MDDKGSIAIFEQLKDAQKAGYKTPLTRDEAEALYPVNRKERRARLAELRREKRRARKSEVPR